MRIIHRMAQDKAQSQGLIIYIPKTWNRIILNKWECWSWRDVCQMVWWQHNTTFLSYDFSSVLGNGIYLYLSQQGSGLDSTHERLSCKIWKAEKQQQLLLLLQAASWAQTDGHMWNPARNFQASTSGLTISCLQAAELTDGAYFWAYIPTYLEKSLDASLAAPLLFQQLRVAQVPGTLHTCGKPRNLV